VEVSAVVTDEAGHAGVLPLGRLRRCGTLPCAAAVPLTESNSVRDETLLCARLTNSPIHGGWEGKTVRFRLGSALQLARFVKARERKPRSAAELVDLLRSSSARSLDG
jgi:hypothetical protein